MLRGSEYKDDKEQHPAPNLNKVQDTNFETDVEVALQDDDSSGRQNFIKLYCDNTDLRKILNNYIRLEECKKPKKVAVLDHQERIKELLRFPKYLHGLRSNLNE